MAHTQVGGYASPIHRNRGWGYDRDPADPRFCRQININSGEKAGAIWGDRTIYMARGTVPGCSDRWFLEWRQCSSS